jgi:hypothetical protein
MSTRESHEDIYDTRTIVFHLSLIEIINYEILIYFGESNLNNNLYINLYNKISLSISPLFQIKLCNRIIMLYKLKNKTNKNLN